MKFIMHKAATGFFCLAVSLLTVDMAAGLAGKSTEEALQELCKGHVKGESKNVDKACKALGCNPDGVPC
jgi:hypothetical protein